MLDSRDQGSCVIEPGEARSGAEWYGAARRLIDLGFSAMLLIPIAPLMLVAMLLVKLTSRGPAVYTQTRVGCDGRWFVIYKIRTMHYNCEKGTGPRWAAQGDSRITPVGRFLRATHIDELPQLFNVLKGDMTLVGPRPERPEFVSKLEQVIPCYRDRLSVPPGVTGLAQVLLPPDVDIESVRTKLSYDLFYLRTQGPWLDAKIIFCTILKVVGAPRALSRSILGVPAHETIEGSYENLIHQAGHARSVDVTEMQAAF